MWIRRAALHYTKQCTMHRIPCGCTIHTSHYSQTTTQCIWRTSNHTANVTPHSAHYKLHSSYFTLHSEHCSLSCAACSGNWRLS